MECFFVGELRFFLNRRLAHEVVKAEAFIELPVAFCETNAPVVLLYTTFGLPVKAVLPHWATEVRTPQNTAKPDHNVAVHCDGHDRGVKQVAAAAGRVLDPPIQLVEFGCDCILVELRYRVHRPQRHGLGLSRGERQGAQKAAANDHKSRRQGEVWKRNT